MVHFQLTINHQFRPGLCPRVYVRLHMLSFPDFSYPNLVQNLYEFWGRRGDVTEDSSLLESSAVSMDEYFPTFLQHCCPSKHRELIGKRHSVLYWKTWISQKKNSLLRNLKICTTLEFELQKKKKKKKLFYFKILFQSEILNPLLH